jgi:YgiT-type zinc finger domain-containing protein
MTMNEVERCPECDNANIREVTREQQFEYGSGEKAVMLSARMPVFECEVCGYQYTDERADKARHEAVCRHEGEFAPDGIVSVRSSAGLSRAKFAALGKFGLASVARWENGALLHNGANDQLIYLFQFPPVIALLEKRQFGETLLSVDVLKERFSQAVQQTGFVDTPVYHSGPRQTKVFRTIRADRKIQGIACAWKLRRPATVR